MKVEGKGLAFGATGVVLLCCMDAVVRGLGAELTTFQIVFVRMFGAALWLSIWIAATRGEWPKAARIPRPAADKQAGLYGKVENDFNKIGLEKPTQKNEGRRTPLSRHDRESQIGNNQSQVRRGTGRRAVRFAAKCRGLHGGGKPLLRMGSVIASEVGPSAG